jgi:hypothetical protein
MATPTFSAFKQFNKKNPAFPIGGINHKRFHRKTNGAEELGVFVAAGGRVYVHEERWFLYLELESTGELDAVVNLIRDTKRKGGYLSPENAVAQVRGVAA